MRLLVGAWPSSEETCRLFAGMDAATDDDVSITTDGRRLDNVCAVTAFIEQVGRPRALTASLFNGVGTWSGEVQLPGTEDARPVAARDRAVRDARPRADEEATVQPADQPDTDAPPRAHRHRQPLTGCIGSAARRR